MSQREEGEEDQEVFDRCAACETTPLFMSSPKAVSPGDKGVGRKEGREEKGEMNSLRLKELSNSDLYRRRQERPDSYGSVARDSLRFKHDDDDDSPKYILCKTCFAI
ncbi:hypothetical protein FQN60_001493 [Etheostoma spectabile]|uniref:Uncharacterized protein n=1 Tax=Etheostoma spectabile TaxID=54343 RepID=A0A5J5D496_9PERO|nr:hypothetical protein FQN60_001493 [Etheostoma spectabile]